MAQGSSKLANTHKTELKCFSIIRYMIIQGHHSNNVLILNINYENQMYFVFSHCQFWPMCFMSLVPYNTLINQIWLYCFTVQLLITGPSI